MPFKSMLQRLVNPKLQLLAVALISFALGSVAATAQSLPAQTTTRLIVKLRDAGMRETQPAAAARLARFTADAAAAGIAITPHRAMALGAHVMRLERPLTVAAATAVAARLAQHPDVEFAQPDLRRHALRKTNDTYVGSQYYLDSVPGAINAFGAWDVTTGSPNVVVAVVDTGYRPHADLAGRIQQGYDFISDVKTANDGDGRDADATDPGDWLDANDQKDQEFSGCDIDDSTWHGTSVAGIIAANADNAQWLAGIDWAAKILPVRVLGKCGGDDSDIIDGVAWAAGLAVPGVPANPNPAQIINLSLGGPGDCLAAYHGVFSAALAHGVTRAIVAAAGNESTDVANSVPANCSEAIAVAATSSTGSLASYSNFGLGVALSAPGGDANDVLFAGIAVLHNQGKTIPDVDGWAKGAGTSFAAPMVAGAASLVLGLAPNLTAAQLRALLTSTAAPFPVNSDCTTARCGAGILDAHAAVVAAQGGAPAASYQGLWWNPGESGWGINFAHQGDTIFASWFTYDINGRGWWLVMTAPKTAPNTYTGTLYQTRGPAFDAVPFLPAQVMPTAVGTGTLTFADGNNATFAYTVNGTSQQKSITRQVFGPQPACVFGGQPNLALATNYQDLWWNAPAASESGWGVNFSHQGSIIFLTWFTYALDGSPMWLVATANQTATPAVYTGTLYQTSGARFDAFDPASVTNTPVGSATLTFGDGNSATFAYTVMVAPLPGPVSQAKTITREIFALPGTACQ